MSWLRNHLRHFALPGVRTLARAQGAPVTAEDIKPWKGTLRPSSKCRWTEAGMVYATIASVVPKTHDKREQHLERCRKLGEPKGHLWLEEYDRVEELGEFYQSFRGPDVIHSVLCASARALRRRLRSEDITILLPGRDVWCWEVIGKKMGLKTHYDPFVSRRVSGHAGACRKRAETWDFDLDKTLVFDTGFAGSIHADIAQHTGKNPAIMLLSASSAPEDRQVFPKHSGSRKKALAFEYLPKYRKRGAVKDGQPYQELADLDEFIDALLFTIWLWKHISPRKVPTIAKNKVRSLHKPAWTKYTPVVNQNNFGIANITPASAGQLTFQTQPLITLANSASVTGTTDILLTSSGTNNIFWDTTNTSTASGTISALDWNTFL